MAKISKLIGILMVLLILYIGFIGYDVYKTNNNHKKYENTIAYISILNKNHREKLYNLLENHKKKQ